MKIHHIGIACKDIEKAISDYKHLYSIKSISDIVFDPLQQASLVYIETEHGHNIEFISGSKVDGLVEKGISYYHLCYEVKDLEASVNNFVSKGAMVVSEPKEAILFNNRRVAFLYTNTGLIELLED